MARHIGWALLALLVARAGAAAEVGVLAAQPQQDRAQPSRSERRDAKSSPGHQRTAWWKDQKARADIGFTPEQAAEIDRIFKTYIEKAKPLREEVDTLERSLSETMKGNTAEVSVVEQQVERVENKRAELNKMRVVMLYRMHRVLTPEQNVRLQTYMDRREADRKKQDGDRRR